MRSASGDSSPDRKISAWYFIVGVSVLVVFWIGLVLIINREPPPAHPSLPALDQPLQRAQAIQTLTKDGFSGAVDRIRGFLIDPNPAVRTTSVEYLARMGQSSDCESIRRLAADTSPTVRLAVAKFFTIVWDGEDASRCLENLFTDSDETVRNAAVTTMSVHLDDPRAQQTVLRAISAEDSPTAESLKAAICEQAKKPDQHSRLLSVFCQLVCELKDPKAGERLARFFPQWNGPEVLPEILDRIDMVAEQPTQPWSATGQERLILALSGLTGATEILSQRAILNTHSPWIVDICRRVLVRIGPSAGPAIAKNLTKWRCYPDLTAMSTWLDLLASWPVHASSAQPLLEVLANHPDQDFRKAGENLASKLSLPWPKEPLVSGPLAALGPDAIPIGKSLLVNAIPENAIVRIVLNNALDAGRSLDVDVIRRAGAWDPRGLASGLNKRFHHVMVDNGPSPQSGGVNLDLQIAVLDDDWITGGWGSYQVNIRPSPDGKGLEGTFTGNYNGKPQSDRAKITIYSLPTIVPLRPMAAKEHPRALWRAQELPEIRKRLNHPIGRQLISLLLNNLSDSQHLLRTKLDHARNWLPGMQAALGYAALAQFYDDPLFAERARLLFQPRSVTMPYGGEHGEHLYGKISMLPLTYDTIYPLLSPEQQIQVTTRTRGNSILWITAEEGGKANFTRTFSQPGVATLVLLGEPGPFNRKEPLPVAPVLDVQPATIQESPKAARNLFQTTDILKSWMMIGPIATQEGDPTQTLRNRPFPIPGETVTIWGRSYSVTTLPSTAFKHSDKKQSTEEYLTPPLEKKGDRVLLLCVLEVTQKVGCEIAFSNFVGVSPRIWLNDNLVTTGTIVQLHPGIYRLMVEAIGTISPKFISADLGTHAAYARRHDFLMQRYIADQKRWQQTGAFGDLDEILNQCQYGIRIQARQCVETADQNTYGIGKGLRPYWGLDEWQFLGIAHRLTGSSGFPDSWHTLPLRAKRQPRAHEKDIIPALNELVFGLMLATPDQRQALAKEIVEQWLPRGCPGMNCLQLVTTFVHFPYEYYPNP